MKEVTMIALLVIQMKVLLKFWLRLGSSGQKPEGVDRIFAHVGPAGANRKLHALTRCGVGFTIPALGNPEVQATDAT